MYFFPYFRCFVRYIVINILIISIITPPIIYAKAPLIVPSTHQVQSTQSQPNGHAQSERFMTKVHVVDLDDFGKAKHIVKKKKWYGYQIIITELLDFIYFVPYFISAPVVHLLNNQPTNALYSFGVRVGFPLLGALAGLGIVEFKRTSNSGENYDDGGEDWSFIIIPLALTFLSAVAAVLFDVTVIAYKDVFVSKKSLIRPTIGEPRTHVLGLGQAPMLKLNFSF